MQVDRREPWIPILLGFLTAAVVLVLLASDAHCETKKPSVGKTFLLNSIGPAVDEAGTRWALAGGRQAVGVEGNPLMRVGGETGRAAIHLAGIAAVTTLDVRWQREGRKKPARILRASKMIYHGVALGFAIHHGRRARRIK